MTVEARDTAQRCDRCQRVTLGTAPCTWHVATGLGEHVAQHFRLCARCRTLVLDGVRDVIRQRGDW